MRSSSSVRMLVWRAYTCGRTPRISPNLCSSIAGSPSSPSVSITADLKSCITSERDLEAHGREKNQRNCTLDDRKEGRGEQKKWKALRNGRGERNGRKEKQILLNILPGSTPFKSLKCFPSTRCSDQASAKSNTSCTTVTHQVSWKKLKKIPAATVPSVMQVHLHRHRLKLLNYVTGSEKAKMFFIHPGGSLRGVNMCRKKKKKHFLT